MRPTIYLTCLSVLLASALTGSASAAPVYAPEAVVGPEYDPGLPAGGSEDALWLSMTDTGAAGLRGGVLGGARGALVWYTVRSEYEGAVGLFPQITFAELGSAQPLTDQYVAISGVDFTDGDDEVFQSSLFLEDWWGVAGGASPSGAITIEFSAPQSHVGFDFAGYLDLEFYAPDGGLVSSGNFGGPGTGHFAGVDLSSNGLEFDKVILTDPFDGTAYIDTLYYHRIPEPGTLLLLGFGALAVVGRKR